MSPEEFWMKNFLTEADKIELPEFRNPSINERAQLAAMYADAALAEHLKRFATPAPTKKPRRNDE